MVQKHNGYGKGIWQVIFSRSIMELKCLDFNPDLVKRRNELWQTRIP